MFFVNTELGNTNNRIMYQNTIVSYLLKYFSLGFDLGNFHMKFFVTRYFTEVNTNNLHLHAEITLFTVRMLFPQTVKPSGCYGYTYLICRGKFKLTITPLRKENSLLSDNPHSRSIHCSQWGQ